MHSEGDLLLPIGCDAEFVGRGGADLRAVLPSPVLRILVLRVLERLECVMFDFVEWVDRALLTLFRRPVGSSWLEGHEEECLSRVSAAWSRDDRCDEVREDFLRGSPDFFCVLESDFEESGNFLST